MVSYGVLRTQGLHKIPLLRLICGRLYPACTVPSSGTISCSLRLHTWPYGLYIEAIFVFLNGTCATTRVFNEMVLTGNRTIFDGSLVFTELSYCFNLIFAHL